MENARVLRSGKSTPSREETPSSGQTTTHETNTWSRGTGVEDTTESSTRTDARAKLNSVPAQIDNVVENVGSAPGTIVNVPGDRASSKLSALQAELEYHNSELARARAASAAAMSRLEIARIELGESTDADQPPRSNKTRVEGWISEQCVRPSTSAQNPGRDPRPTENIEPRAGNTSLSDMTLLANAIVQAVNSSRSEATPKFIHELPHFDGTITEWMAFKSVFNDTADMFSDIQNVARLRKALRGAARETVRALLYTVSDPYEIIDTLERRYGRPELLILSEIENIKRLPRMTEDGRNVSSFASKISNTVAAIKSLNQPQYLYSPELVGRIVDKLNIILKYKWYEFKSERPGAPELELMARFLNIMADQCGAMFAYETAREERRGKMKPRASFVAHRLAEIESTTTPADWRWVPSADNVADDATKGIPVNFSSTHRWFTGPSFILDDPATWPCEKRTAVPLPPSGEERIIKQVHVCVDHVNNDYLPKVERFSKYKRLVRAAATVLLSAEAFKAKLLKRKVNTEISPDHIRLAELLLIKRSQNISFADDIKTIEAGQRPPKRSPFHKLAVKLDRSGILYLDSRVKEEYNLPVLHAKEEFTRLLVHHTHAVFNHGNHQTVMNELRQRYHIIGLRSILRYICNKCQWCRTYRGTPSKIPLGDLPPERLAHNQPPFTALAVDYFGPMQVTIGRRHEKRWGAIYTCLTTRAVHLELVPSLSASSMIMSLRRMMSRRGTPTVIYSDNGTNFVGAEKEVTEALQQNDDAMKVFASGKQIIWKRIPPGAPNMGGAWERLVRSVKAALRVTLTEKTPPDEVLHTLLLEAEHVINTRPLTPVNPDLNEESLTPNHFLIGRSSGMIPFGSYKDYTADSRSWKAAQKLAEAFWARWVAEYKPQLMPRLGNPQHSNLNPGDIVIICDRTMPRGIWPRGEIIKTFPGPDGRVRVAEVRTAAGLIRRPASRLILVSSQE
ncbi:uncharacterized protein LOC121728040 [Aricia agestis]|uniref:uncharacterized protein LOC121728040 n=1 Tax=Aricia agestis TaxID=91739 RepID=UPI001C2073BF|nr:uncharacterized protein LOC121728040 [Aricia agestis]